MAERIHFHRQLDSLFRTQMAAGGETDLRDFLRNREEWLEAEQKAEALRVYRQHMLVKEGYDSLAYINTDSLIRAEDILRVVENLNLDENVHPDLAEIASEGRYLDSELDVERAKDRKILDFAQVRYTTREDLLFENRFSVGVGINIPWSGASRLRHEDIRIKQEENQFDKNNRIASLERDLQDKKAEAKALYSTYILYSRYTTDKDWQNTRTLIEQSGRIDPADIFRLKIYDLERAEKAGDTYADLLRVYVEALYYAGRLDGGRIFER
jgi:hypothetical protein